MDLQPAVGLEGWGSALLPVPRLWLGAAACIPVLDHENSPFPWPLWCVETLGNASVLNRGGAAIFPPAPPHPPDPTEAAWGRMEKRRRTLKGGKIFLLQLLKVEEEKEPEEQELSCAAHGGLCVHTPTFHQAD